MDFLGDIKAAVTSLVTVFVGFPIIGSVAFITEHVYLLDQRDTLKGAANAASIATTLEQRDQLLAEGPKRPERCSQLTFLGERHAAVTSLTASPGR